MNQSPAGTAVRYPLTWLRGIAALAVLTFHSYQHSRSGPTAVWPWSGAAHRAMLGTELFVDMFFVLSGFVLWLPVASAALEGRQDRPGWVVLFRRVARLLPLYWTVVLVVWAMSNPSLPGHWQDLVLHLGFLQVYSDHFVFWTDGPAWSLAVEFHFYLLMALSIPLVARAAARTLSTRVRTAVALVLPAALMTLGAAYLLWETRSGVALDNWSVLFSPMSRAADFGFGTALAVVAARGFRLPAAARVGTAVVGVGALVALVATRPFTLEGEWWHPLYALAIAVALSSIVLHDGPWPRALELRSLTWLGGLGYGVYLIHEPVLRLLDHLGAFPASRPGGMFLVGAVLLGIPSVALAWLSSVTIERAGARMTATLTRDGRPRDYYGHLQEEPTPVGAGSAAQ